MKDVLSYDTFQNTSFTDKFCPERASGPRHFGIDIDQGKKDSDPQQGVPDQPILPEDDPGDDEGKRKGSEF
jgi:hypothetical protein